MTRPRPAKRQRVYMVRVKGFGHVSQQRYTATSLAEAERKARERYGVTIEAHEVER